MEDSLILLAWASPELGTAQPPLVFIFIRGFETKLSYFEQLKVKDALYQNIYSNQSAKLL